MHRTQHTYISEQHNILFLFISHSISIVQTSTHVVVFYGLTKGIRALCVHLCMCELNRNENTQRQTEKMPIFTAKRKRNNNKKEVSWTIQVNIQIRHDTPLCLCCVMLNSAQIHAFSGALFQSFQILVYTISMLQAYVSVFESMIRASCLRLQCAWNCYCFQLCQRQLHFMHTHKVINDAATTLLVLPTYIDM